MIFSNLYTKILSAGHEVLKSFISPINKMFLEDNAPDPKPAVNLTTYKLSSDPTLNESAFLVPFILNFSNA